MLTCFLRSLHDGRTSPRRDGGARRILWILWIRQRPSLLHEAREPLVGRLPWPACGQPVASPDDPGVRRFRELEQEVKVWADRYPFIAELKDHSIRAKPEWLVVASNYPLEELTNASRNPTFYHALFRRTDDGRRLFHFTTHCYKPDTVPVDAETRRHYHRRLERFVEIVVNSH